MPHKFLKIVLVLVCLGLLSISSFGSDDIDIEILLQQNITVKDGFILSANVYKPAEMPKPLPVIFAFTPYISDEGQSRGPKFAKNGYVYVHADVRGRGHSGGKYFPLEKDGIDGAQIVAWITKQPWCNGEVVMRGGSYRGMVQWQTLKHFPAGLKTIVPTASVGPGIDYPAPKNIFLSYTARWLGFTVAKTRNDNFFADGTYWQDKYYKMYSEHLPFSKLAEITGSNNEIFQRWVSHPGYDDFWKQTGVPDSAYKKISIPILTITGHFDGDQPGAMSYYKKHMALGNSGAKENHYLVIGPWTHGGTRRPSKQTGGLVFGDNSVLDMDKLHLEWYDWRLKGKEKPALLKNRVSYYMMGENKWKYAGKLEDISNYKMVWYLSSENGSANDVFHSGKLAETMPMGKQKPDTFEYDPLDIISKKEYLEMRNDPRGLLSQRLAFSGDKVVYHSAPLQDRVEVAGYVKVKVFLALNVPDTDLRMELSEIQPDGKSIYLADDMVRARYRKSLSKAELVTPGKIEPYLFDGAYFFARKLKKGSRLRLVISGIDTPDYEKNYNSGGVVANETAKDARKAIIKLYHSKKYPSMLELPVMIRKGN
ncbi:MAG: CocE/NonD family hydrolase [bacterium]|nr:CocE/NonD family hydrolase [bacterium]